MKRVWNPWTTRGCRAVQEEFLAVLREAWVQEAAQDWLPAWQEAWLEVHLVQERQCQRQG